MYANNYAEATPPELQGPMLRSCLGPRSSRFERLKQFSMFNLGVLGSSNFRFSELRGQAISDNTTWLQVF
eukprot:4824717-Alexandrium_andersonii.AAC.1